jgi:hypothetical protein
MAGTADSVNPSDEFDQLTAREPIGEDKFDGNHHWVQLLRQFYQTLNANP